MQKYQTNNQTFIFIDKIKAINADQCKGKVVVNLEKPLKSAARLSQPPNKPQP